MKSNIYLIEYQDNFSYKKKLTELIKKNNFTDNLMSEYDLSETTLELALEDLDTYSFLSEKKIIVIKGVETLDIENKDTKHLLKYLEAPDSNKLLVMTSNNLDSRKKITKELKNKSNYLKLEDDPKKVIQEELNKYTLEPGVIDLILDYTNNNIDSIKNECDKLKEYKDQSQSITTTDIKDICYKKIGDSTQLIFDLVRAICSKNKKEALIIYQKLNIYNIDDISIIGLLESQLRLLEQLNILMDKHKRKQEISTILNIHPYRIEKTMELLRYITKKDINNLIISLGEIDYKTKSGIYEIKKSLEFFLLNL